MRTRSRSHSRGSDEEDTSPDFGFSASLCDAGERDNKVIPAKNFIHQHPHAMHIFIPDLHKNAAGIGQQIAGKDQAVAQIAQIGMDADTVSAGLLHDTLEDTDTTEEEIATIFGKEVGEMVQAVTKISRITDEKSIQEAETIKKMFFAMSKDLRVILIKLADKLSEIPISPKEFSPDVLESRPDWLMFSLAAENANAQIALAKAGRFEDIEVGLFFEANTSIDEPVGKSREKALGLSVSVPLPLNSFDGTINEKLALRRQAQIRSASKENQIRSEIYVYRMRARKYSKILKSYKSEVENPNKDIYTQYIAARKNAQADISEVFGAWQTNLQLKLIRISITAEQARNSVSLKYALGVNKNEK